MRNDVSKNRQFLKQLLTGKKPQLLINVLDIMENVRYVSIREGKRLITSKPLLPDQVGPCIEQCKKDYPAHTVTVGYVSRETCEAIKAKLEAEY